MGGGGGGGGGGGWSKRKIEKSASAQLYVYTSVYTQELSRIHARDKK